MIRITRVVFIFLGLWSAVFSATAATTDYPRRPIHLVVGFAPGGGSDTLSRLIAQKLSVKWGQGIVVDNRPGADGSIAADYVSRAAPDGYTIFMPNTNLTIPPVGYKPNYDPITSFAAITQAANVPDILVVNPKQIPAHSLQDLVLFVKERPGKIFFGSGGIGQFLEMVILMNQTGMQMTNINYNGGNPALTAMLGGQVQMTIASVASLQAQVKAGTIRAIAIAGTQRSPSLPDVPTFAEAAKISMDAGWYGLVAPAGTPPEVIAKLHDGIAAVLDDPAIQQTMSTFGFFHVSTTPAQFEQLMQREVVKWNAISRQMSDKHVR